ncbi:MAG: flagellar biosynthetic protein FliO [Treponema sp.]|nr:flagellar biosynthetic protein FliO [Treponema sp.]
MGGEKLNRFHLGRAIVFFAVSIFIQDIYLIAQANTGEAITLPEGEGFAPLPGAEDESAIILGEAVSGVGISPVSSGFVVLRMVLALALVAAAVYGVVFFLRRASRPRESRNSHLKILAAAGLGSSRFVYVVNVGSQAWLIGAGEGGVSLIAELKDKESIDAMLLEDSQNQAESPGKRFPDFRTLLRRFGGGTNLPPDRPDFSAENLRKNRERLRGL